MNRRRRQVNIKLIRDDNARVESLLQRIHERHGYPIHFSDLFRMALAALERQLDAETAKGKGVPA